MLDATTTISQSSKGSVGTVLSLPRGSGAARVISDGRPSREECQKRDYRYHGVAGGPVAILDDHRRRTAGHPMPSRTSMPLDGGTDDPIAAVYDEQFEFLRRIAAGKFGIPAPDDEGIVHDVFVTYLRQRGKVINERRWLVAAVCNACRAYWRSSAKHGALRETRELATSTDSAMSSRIDARRLLRRLPERCRELLRLKFYDGCTANDLAAHYRTSVPYAKLMLHRCMAAARAVLRGERR